MRGPSVASVASAPRIAALGPSDAAPLPEEAERPSPLQKLFAPRAIALYGASNDPASLGYRAFFNLKSSGFAGAIVPINPRYTEVAGHRCHSSALEYDGPIDHAMCVVAAARVMGVMEDCAKAGIPTAGVYAGGFSEIGAEGKRLERELSGFADRAGMRILGPNSLGYASGLSRTTASIGTIFEKAELAAGGLAIVSQSGALASALLAQCKGRGVDVGFFVSTGNEMDVEVADCIDYLRDRPSITRIAVYVEGVRDAVRLRSGLRRARLRGQDVIVLRAGRTEAGRAAVKSHTASLTTDARLYEALFREMGAITVSSLRELGDVARVTELRTTVAEAVAIVTSSGASAALAADACAASSLPLARIPKSTQRALRAIVPDCTPGNPIDMTGRVSQDPDMLRPVFSVLLDDPAITRVVFMHGSGMWSPGRGEKIAATLAELAGTYGSQRLIFVGDVPEHIREALEAARIPIFDDAVVLLSQLGRVRAARMTRTPPDARSLPGSSGRTRVLLESTALGILEKAGIAVVKRVLVEDRSAARGAGSSLGLPVVAKAVLADVTHKARIGAIRPDLRSGEALRRAWKDLAALSRARGATPRVLVEKQVEGARAEILLSAFVDRILGPFVGIATGGSLTELLDDIVFLPVPVTAARVRRALQELRSWPAISHDPARAEHVALVAATVLRMQRLLGGAAHDRLLGVSGRIVAIEVNPFLLAAKGSCAVDAVIEVVPERS